MYRKSEAETSKKPSQWITADRLGPTNPQAQKRQNPLDGGFKLCGEVTTLNTIQYFLRTR